MIPDPQDFPLSPRVCLCHHVTSCCVEGELLLSPGLHESTQQDSGPGCWIAPSQGHLCPWTSILPSGMVCPSSQLLSPSVAGVLGKALPSWH